MYSPTGFDRDGIASNEVARQGLIVERVARVGRKSGPF
jgi:hypothetical protein